MPHSFKTTIAEIRAAQVEAVRLFAEVDSKISKLDVDAEEEIRKSFRAAFGKAHRINLLFMFRSGCHTADWTPDCSAEGVDGQVLCDDGLWRAGSVVQETYLTSDAPSVAPPVDAAAFRAWAAAFTESTGIRIVIDEAEVVRREDIVVEDIKSIQRRWPDAEILYQGEIVYRGWDGTDEVAVVKHEGKTRIFMGTGGHGGGFGRIVEHGDSAGFAEAIAFLQENDRRHVRDVLACIHAEWDA